MNTLPAGWILAKFGDLCTIRLGKMLDSAKNIGNNTKYLRNINVRWGEFNLDDILELKLTQEEKNVLDIRDGDLLICEGGEPGRCAIWTGGPNNFTFQKALLRARVYDGVNPNWLAYYLKHCTNTDDLREYLTGTTIKHLPQIAISKIELPLPPAHEQNRIVEKVERLFSYSKRAREELKFVGQIANQTQSARVLLNRLDQSILAKAFSGELVPQDPNDEPASVLLDRIQAERAALGSAPKRGRRPRTASGA